MNHQVILFVEGDDDERFVRHLLSPKFAELHVPLRIQQYASGKMASASQRLLKFAQNEGLEYYWLADLDTHPCVSSKKAELQKLWGVPPNRVLVAAAMIEGWYLSGVTPNKLQAMGSVRNFNIDPSRAHHSSFDSVMPKKYSSRIQFMLDLLKRFDCQDAAQRSGSFRYARDKLSVIFPSIVGSKKRANC